MKTILIYKYFLALSLFALMALTNGCHGVQW